MHAHLPSPHPIFSWHISCLRQSVFLSQAKQSVGIHFLAKLQSTKGNQAGISPNYHSSHQSTQLPRATKERRFSGTALADPGALPWSHCTAFSPEKQPLSGHKLLCIIKMTSQNYHCSGLSKSAASESTAPGGLF